VIRARAIGGLLLALSLGSSSCNEADPRSGGLEALQAGEHERAAKLLGEALADIDPGAPEYVEVAMGRCSALAHVDADACLVQFEQLENGGSPKPADYAAITGELTRARKHAAAIALVDRGIARFPDDQDLIALRTEVQQAQSKPEKTSEQAAMDGFGYTGGGDD